MPPRPAAPERNEVISTVQKVRLALLLVLLVTIVAVALVVNGVTARREAARRRAADAAIQQVRDRLRAMDMPGAVQSLAQARTMADDTARAEELTVAVLYASGDLDGAFREFDRLNPSGAGALGTAGSVYIRQCGILWNVARRLTAGAADDREKALALGRWFAFYMLPRPDADARLEPYSALLHGYGNRSQLAWTFAELAAQAGVPCRVAALPDGEEPALMVEVEPASGKPFLFDPFYGVPVADPASGRLLSLADVQRDRGPYDALMALGGLGPDEAPPLDRAQLRSACHPVAGDPRLVAFERIMADLPMHPRIAVPGGSVPPDLWGSPMRLMGQQASPEEQAAEDRQTSELQLVGSGRTAALLGGYDDAESAYARAAQGLAASRAETDVAQAAALFAGAAERLAFYRAANAHEAGRLDMARQRLLDYLQTYPRGDWAPLARTLAADAAGTEADWGALPPERRLYGAMRARGLLAAPARDAAAADDPATRPTDNG